MGYETEIIKGIEVPIDSFLKKKLDLVLKLQEKDFDILFLIDGKEGSGKSTLSFLCAWYLSKGNLTMKNICEGSEDAADKLEHLPDESVMIIDEGSLLFSSKDTMKAEQRRLIKILNVIRQKRMILIIVAPSFFDLQKYISVDRSRFLLHVYTDQKTYYRGKFTYFGEKKKRILYQVGKKNFNSYAYPRSDFVGRYPKFELPFNDEYLKLKKRSLMEALHEKKKEIDKATKKEIQLEILREIDRKTPDIPNKTKIEWFGTSKASFYRDFRGSNAPKPQIPQL